MPRWLESPQALPRLAVLLCVLVAAIAAAVRYPSVLEHENDLAERNAQLSFTDREIAGGNAAIPLQRAMYEARVRIAEDETYEVAIGERLDDWPPLAPDSTATYVRYFLSPRREAPGAADWALCFNCDLSGYPGEVVWQEDESALVRRSP